MSNAPFVHATPFICQGRLPLAERQAVYRRAMSEIAHRQVVTSERRRPMDDPYMKRGLWGLAGVALLLSVVVGCAWRLLAANREAHAIIAMTGADIDGATPRGLVEITPETCRASYIVNPDESIWRVARAFNLPRPETVALNTLFLKNVDLVHPGDQICLMSP